MRVRTRFDPRRHAPPFANCFPRGTPVVHVPLGFRTLGIGDASAGLCGGMVSLALDCFLWGVPPPTRPTDAVVRYLARRLLESWDFPFGVLQYYHWQARPQRDITLGGAPVLLGVASLTRHEWPKIRAQLDRGVPVPLGVVQERGLSPKLLPRHHQILAHGYDESAGGAVELAIYDPNHPGEVGATLGLPAGDGGHCRHSVEGGRVRGVFVSHYAAPLAAPTLG